MDKIFLIDNALESVSIQEERILQLKNNIDNMTLNEVKVALNRIRDQYQINVDKEYVATNDKNDD